MKIEVNLKPKQYKAFIKGGSIQLSTNQLQNLSPPTKYLTSIDLNDVGMKKMNKSIKKYKGFRLSNIDHSGGSLKSIMKSVKKSVNKSNKGISNAFNDSTQTIANTMGNVGSEVVKTANMVDKWAKKEDLGGYVEQVKKVVPQSALTTILTTALIAGATASGQPYLIAGAPILAQSATTAFYKTDFSKNLNGQGETVLKSAVMAGAQEGVKAGIKSQTTKPKETTGGQISAKDRMAYVRSMRKSKNGSSISSTLSGIKQSVFGQTGYTNPINELLKKYGNQSIKSITIVRSPVESTIISAMNAVSLGAFRKNMDKNNIDKLWHLQLDVVLNNRQTIAIEKVEVVNLRVGITEKKGQEEEAVELNRDITLQELMDNCQKSMKSKFFSYSASSNNCQDFLLSLLKSSGIGAQDDYDFIKQSTEALFKNQPRLKNISNSLTGLGAKLNILQNGGSFRVHSGSFKGGKIISSGSFKTHGGSFRGGSFKSN